MADIDKNNPTDDAIVSQYPSNERNSRSAIEEIVDEDHYALSGAGADQGQHRFVTLVEQAADPTALANKVILYAKESGGVAEAFARFEGGTILQLTKGNTFLSFPTGTKVGFFQASAPTGWTQDTSQNDKVLRVVSGTGGGSGGSWTISGVTVDGHALTISEIPAHDHSVPEGGTRSSGIGYRSGAAQDSKAGQTTGSRGGGAAHTHGLTADGTWRPAYIDMIIATKD